MAKQINYGMKRGRFLRADGMVVGCDGTTIKDRKPSLKLKPNHRTPMVNVYRVYNVMFRGPARSDGKGWYI